MDTTYFLSSSTVVSMRTLTESAPAKVNLGLRILNRSSDGYHEIRTILQAISLVDVLSVSYNENGPDSVTVECDVKKLSNSDNVVVRAAKAILAAAGHQGEVVIQLSKKIPVAAGLGGGSSDAATVLKLLRRLLRPIPPISLIHEVAAAIGSDVPFFLLGGTAVGVGRGEEVYPLPNPPERWLLLLVPKTRIVTEEAYQSLYNERSKGNFQLTVEQRHHIISGFCSNTFGPGGLLAPSVVELPQNDFESVFYKDHPEFVEWKNRLLEAGASVATLSGSGSALFGIFVDRGEALQARKLMGLFPGESYVVKTLSRAGVDSV